MRKVVAAVACAVAVGLTSLTSAFESSADAAVNATLARAVTATSAKWAAVSCTTTSGCPASTTTINTAALGTSNKYLYIVNTGTANLGSGFLGAYGVSGSGLNLGYVQLSACTGGTWNETTNVCSGTEKVLASTAGGGTPVASPPLPAVAGGNLRVRLLFNAVLLSASATISLSVSRSAASGTTTNS